MDSQRTPAVSVGIPFYNAESYIERCARSLFSQTLKDLEFVFVDDASTDRGVEVLRRVASEFPERRPSIRIIRQPRNLGPQAARMTALRAFTGRYVIFCDVDDFVDDETYAAMYDLARSRGVDVVHCGHTLHHKSGKVSPDRELCDIRDIRVFRRMIAAHEITPSVWSLLFRRELLTEEGIYLPEHIRCSEDFLFVSQLLRRCGSVACCTGRGYYHYIRRDGSLSHTNRRRNLLNSREVLRYLDRTEKDPETAAARRTSWRDLLYSAWRDGMLTVNQRNAILRRRCGGFLADPRLKWKKRLRMLLLLLFPRMN